MRYTKQEWLKSTEEMNRIFADIPEVLTNTLEVAEKVEFYSIDHSPLMPFYPIDPAFGTEESYKKQYPEEALIEEFGKETFHRLGDYNKVIRVKLEADYLTHLTKIGAQKRYGDDLNEEIIERLQFELDTIKNMGFPVISSSCRISLLQPAAWMWQLDPVVVRQRDPLWPTAWASPILIL